MFVKETKDGKITQCLNCKDKNNCLVYKNSGYKNMMACNYWEE